MGNAGVNLAATTAIIAGQRASRGSQAKLRAKRASDKRKNLAFLKQIDRQFKKNERMEKRQAAVKLRKQKIRRKNFNVQVNKLKRRFGLVRRRKR